MVTRRGFLGGLGLLGLGPWSWPRRRRPRGSEATPLLKLNDWREAPFTGAPVAPPLSPRRPISVERAQQSMLVGLLRQLRGTELYGRTRYHELVKATPEVRSVEFTVSDQQLRALDAAEVLPPSAVGAMGELLVAVRDWTWFTTPHPGAYVAEVATSTIVDEGVIAVMLTTYRRHLGWIWHLEVWGGR
jgi:hypothetical protein